MAGLEDALAYADGDRSRGMAQQVKVADVYITHLREKPTRWVSDELKK